MNDLQKQFEEETGLKSHESVTDGVHIIGIDVVAEEYVKWLESQLTWRSVDSGDMPETQPLHASDCFFAGHK